MRVTIKGLTDCTITFNTIGIILRGNSNRLDLYPGSIAKSIDIKTEEQMRELVSLKNAKLISYIDENETVQIPLSTKNIVPSIIPVKLSVPTIKVEDTKFIPVEEVEDMPSAQPNTKEEKTLINKKKAGRPKGSTKAAMKKIAKSTKDIKVIKVIKPVTRSKNITPVIEKKEEDSKTIVMTINGPVEANAVNNMAGEIKESEATKASIEALRQMENEEKEPESLVNENKLKDEEKMGGTAVVATGNNSVLKVAMRNSVLPEAEAIKKRGIKFIDPTGDNNSLDENTNDLDDSFSPFIDNNETESDDNDTFIEL